MWWGEMKRNKCLMRDAKKDRSNRFRFQMKDILFFIFINILTFFSSEIALVVFLLRNKHFEKSKKREKRKKKKKICIAMCADCYFLFYFSFSYINAQVIMWMIGWTKCRVAKIFLFLSLFHHRLVMLLLSSSFSPQYFNIKLWK